MYGQSGFVQRWTWASSFFGLYLVQKLKKNVNHECELVHFSLNQLSFVWPHTSWTVGKMRLYLSPSHISNHLCVRWPAEVLWALWPFHSFSLRHHVTLFKNDVVQLLITLICISLIIWTMFGSTLGLWTDTHTCVCVCVGCIPVVWYASTHTHTKLRIYCIYTIAHNHSRTWMSEIPPIIPHCCADMCGCCQWFVLVNLCCTSNPSCLENRSNMIILALHSKCPEVITVETTDSISLLTSLTHTKLCVWRK